MKGLFEQWADRGLKEVREIATERGVQYSDNWRTCHWDMTRGIFTEFFSGTEAPELEDDAKFRLLALAVQVDIKHSRCRDKVKIDSLIDLAAFSSALATALSDERNHHTDSGGEAGVLDIEQQGQQDVPG